MIGKKISHYKILEELGSGGMGVVYKAEDVKLNRLVALKFVVPRMLRKTEDKERFLREARTAASLNHPNICTIFQIEEVEDSTFIVMEYIEGKSIKEIIGNGPLGLDKALDFAIQIARGLEEAQEKNIVHRDIKGSNIMVTPRAQVKIMDFGLAKMVSDVPLTETASIMGTVAYMSPEQASGDTIDHRSDIWSLGVVLYEMLSGELPFQGDHEQLVLYSILNKLHKPVSGLRPGIPIAMERIVDKCLEKDPAERYQHAGELLADLKWLKKETESGIVPRTKPTWKRRKAKKTGKLVIPGILVFVAALLVSGYFLFDRFKSPVPRKASIAVLPIEDWSLEKDHEAECRHTTRALITKIAALSPELTVIQYNAILMQSRSGKDNLAIARELNVEYILDSVLQSDGKRLLIRSDLVSVRENRVQKSFQNVVSEAEETSIIDIQDSLSKDIVKEIGVHLKEEGLIAAKKGEPQNEDAYKWYVQGMYAVESQDGLPAQVWFDSAKRLFQNAINLDPDYALAYWGLGAAYEAYYIETRDAEDLKQTIANWEKAYALDPNLAETNLGLGWAFFYKEDLGRASQMFQKAIELDPTSSLMTSSLINCDVGAFLASIGLFNKAIDYYSKSIEVDSGYTRAYVSSAKCHWYIGEFATGARILEKALEFVQEDYLMHLEYASHLIMLGLFDKAEEELSLVEKFRPDDARLVRSLLDVYEGETEKALAFVQQMDNKHHYLATCIYSLLGMNDEAIENIKRGIEIGFKEESRCLYCYLMLQNHPCYQSLHDDPRFIEILNTQKEKYERWLKLYGNF